MITSSQGCDEPDWVRTNHLSLALSLIMLLQVAHEEVIHETKVYADGSADFDLD